MNQHEQRQDMYKKFVMVRVVRGRYYSFWIHPPPPLRSSLPLCSL